MIRGTRVLLLLSAGLALLVLPSPGAVRLREDDGKIVKWDLKVPGQPNVVGGKITYYIHYLGTMDVPTEGNEFDAVRRAFATWEDVETSGISFLEDQSRSALRQDSSDRVNLIKWESNQIDPFTLALTFPNSNAGVMFDADLILNENFTWDTSTPGTEFIADIEAVVVHEIGHMIGLDHVPHGRSTMFWELPLGGIKARTLEPDDEAGITALYPDPDTTSDRGAIRGKVAISGKGDDRGVLVVAIDLFHRLPAASALSTAGGQYEIPQMLSGQYIVLALPATGVETMVPYWYSSRTDEFGQVWGAGKQNPGRPQLVRVKPGNTTFGVDFLDLEAKEDENEPNDGALRAVPIRMNEVAFGLAESSTDDDWYVFEGRAGDRISVHADAWHLGARTNITLALYGPDGATLLARVIDIRPKIEKENQTSLDGVDTDAWIDNFVLKEDGRHYVVVDVSPNSNAGTPSNYYVLSLFSAHTAPDDESTEVSAWPPAIPADGEYQTLLTITPRNLAGDLLPAGSVTVDIRGQGTPGSDHGTVSEVTSLVNGSYTAVVTAPTTPGRESFDLTLTSPTGSVEIPDAILVDYLGPPDADRSTFRADPGRIEADGSATAVLVLKAIDARGAAYGPGLPVEIAFDDEPDGAISDVRDEGEGTYSATVTAPDLNSSDSFHATLAGWSLNRQATLHYGFSLPSVVDDALATLDAILLEGGLRRPVAKRLGKSRKKLVDAKDLLVGGPRSESKAVGRLARAMRLYRKARKKSRDLLPNLPFEIGEGARRHTYEVLANIFFNPPDPKGRRRLDRAQKVQLKGASLVSDGNGDRGLRRFSEALRIAVKLR